VCGETTFEKVNFGKEKADLLYLKHKLVIYGHVCPSRSSTFAKDTIYL